MKAAAALAAGEDTDCLRNRKAEAKVLVTDREFSATIEQALQKLRKKPLVIDIDDELIERAMQRYGFRTKKETVDFALRQIVRKPLTREEFLSFEGTNGEDLGPRQPFFMFHDALTIAAAKF